MDEANNQYDDDIFGGGALGFKELYPNVTVRGYKIYDSLPDSAQLARVIVKQGYPENMWTFDVALK